MRHKIRLKIEKIEGYTLPFVKDERITLIGYK